MRAVEAGDLDRHEREARLGDERRLEATRLAEEHDLVATCAELLGEREGGIDVPGGAAGGDCDLHLRFFPLSFEPPRRRSVALGPRSMRDLPDG